MRCSALMASAARISGFRAFKISLSAPVSRAMLGKVSPADAVKTKAGILKVLPTTMLFPLAPGLAARSIDGDMPNLAAMLSKVSPCWIW